MHKILNPVVHVLSRTERQRSTDGHWFWRGPLDKCGKGQINITAMPRQPVRPQHLLWSAMNGPIPPDRWLFKLCDAAGCVRPSHHACLTPVEISALMCAENRQTSTLHDGRVTEGQVRDVMSRYAAGEQLTDLAREIGLARHTVYGWIEGRTLSCHVAPDLIPACEQRRRLHASGRSDDGMYVTPVEAARRLGVTRQRVCQLVKAGKLQRVAKDKRVVLYTTDVEQRARSARG